MPAEVSWLSLKRVVYVRFYGTLVLSDIQGQIRQSDALIAEGTTPVHFIIDTLMVDHYDFTLGQIRGIFPAIDRKVGWTVIYGPSKITRFFASLIMQMIKGNVRFVDSYDEALEFIAHNDSTLANLGSAQSQK